MIQNQLFSGPPSALWTACRRAGQVALLLVLGHVAPALAGSRSAPGVEMRPAVIYHNYCSVCHGDKGDGRSRAQNSLKPPPLDFTTTQAAQIPRARMVEVVTNGRVGTAMTGWKTQLNQKEIEAVVDYVRNTFMPASSSADSSRGRSVYSKSCSVCHGEKGDGRSRAQGSLIPAPRDFTAPSARAELSRERMITSVTYGRPDTAMSGFITQLSKDDINAVVDYILAGFMASTEGISGIYNARRQAPPNAGAPASVPSTAPAADKPHGHPGHVHKAVTVNMSLPMPKALKGNVTKGGIFYQANCATCHGKTGDGRGPRAYFINPKPRNFLHSASREMLNRVELFEMISEGKPNTEMPAWDKVLSPQEIADVAEFVFQRFIVPGKGGSKSAKTNPP
ncbi:c-type cytochrome [Rhodoferax sp.]|uniref:c-type cytochrome n=1 Tax=Rhodoferax sp. TaxID=50421 RepID=UPI002766219E|nr:c-type cytochrome [Rhodoferax sp.]